MNAFDDYLGCWSVRVDAALGAVLPAADRPPRSVHEAMRYTVFAGGKRFRPVLCLLSARAAGGAEEEAMPAACAVEMVHAFSLIHDDLPAMDDDDLRRGKPTNHKVFGEGVAVLAGDGLLTHAFGALTTLSRREVVADAVTALADAVGTSGLVGGQVEDLAAEGRTPDLDTVLSIHTKKTAALLVACARLGGLAAGGEPGVVARLADFAGRIGLAFQIVDDVLDETQDAEVLGKTAGKDRAEAKMTYPAAIGIDASVARARELCTEAAAMVADLPGGEILGALASRVVERTH